MAGGGRTMDAARWALERERHGIRRRDQPRPDRTIRMGEAVTALMKRLGLAERVWERALVQEWESLVGRDVARHTRPGRLHGRILCVYVDSSVWLMELDRFGKRRMEERLRDRFGAARVARVRLEADPGRSASSLGS